MANNTISQIQIGDTTYDICDNALRDTGGMEIDYHKIERTVGQQSITGATSKTVTWNGDNTLSDKYFVSYSTFNLGTIYIYLYELKEEYIKVAHIRGSGYTTTFTPTAFQLWISFHYV